MGSTIKFTTIAAASARDALVADWLNSIRAQRHRNWEAILVEYQTGSGRVMHWSSSTPRGTAKPIKLPSSRNDALNLGLAMASGDVICLLPCHCTYKHNTVFEKIAQCFEEPEVDCVCGDLELKKQDGKTRIAKPIPTSKDFVLSDKGKWLPHEECLFVRRDWWDFFGGLDTRYRRGAGLARVLDLIRQPGIEMRYLNEVMVTHSMVQNRRTPGELHRWIEEMRILASRGLLVSHIRHLSSAISKPQPMPYSPDQMVLRQRIAPLIVGDIAQNGDNAAWK